MKSIIPTYVPTIKDTLKIVEGLPAKGIKPGRIGLVGLEGFRYYVYDPDRSKNFYLSNLGFKEVARANSETEKREGASTVVYGAGHARVEVSSPIDNRSWARKFLDIHPDGVSNLIFRVKDLDYTIAFLAERGAAFINHLPFEVDQDGDVYRSISIASPLGDVVFTFVERGMKYDNHAPGYELTGELVPKTEFNYRFVDHITSNTRTMMPTIWFYKYIMGMEEYWNIQFHTSDGLQEDQCLDWHKNSGLRSIVMWDPDSGIKFATNEPLAPNYYNSQISRYCDDNFGSGVQHVALAVPEITEVVDELFRRKVLFLDSPEEYYNQLPERMKLHKIFNLDEPIDRLRELGILLDGEDNHYLLQIFMKDSATTYEGDRKAGPFFYELIQRRGHQGFGEGNFRALFEAIESEQSKGHDVDRKAVLDSAVN